MSDEIHNSQMLLNRFQNFITNYVSGDTKEDTEQKNEQIQSLIELQDQLSKKEQKCENQKELNSIKQNIQFTINSLQNVCLQKEQQYLHEHELIQNWLQELCQHEWANILFSSSSALPPIWQNKQKDIFIMLLRLRIILIKLKQNLDIERDISRRNLYKVEQQSVKIVYDVVLDFCQDAQTHMKNLYYPSLEPSNVQKKHRSLNSLIIYEMYMKYDVRLREFSQQFCQCKWWQRRQLMIKTNNVTNIFSELFFFKTHPNWCISHAHMITTLLELVTRIKMLEEQCVESDHMSSTLSILNNVLEICNTIFDEKLYWGNYDESKEKMIIEQIKHNQYSLIQLKINILMERQNDINKIEFALEYVPHNCTKLMMMNMLQKEQVILKTELNMFYSEWADQMVDFFQAKCTNNIM